MENKDHLTKASFGHYGHVILDSSYSGSDIFESVVCTSDAIISYTNNLKGDKTITDLSLVAGAGIFGNISNVTVTSGVLIGYLIA